MLRVLYVKAVRRRAARTAENGINLVCGEAVRFGWRSFPSSRGRLPTGNLRATTGNARRQPYSCRCRLLHRRDPPGAAPAPRPVHHRWRLGSSVSSSARRRDCMRAMRGSAEPGSRRGRGPLPLRRHPHRTRGRWSTLVSLNRLPRTPRLSASGQRRVLVPRRQEWEFHTGINEFR